MSSNKKRIKASERTRTITYRNCKIQGLNFLFDLNLNPLLPTQFGGGWGLFGEGRKRIDLQKLRLKLSLTRFGKTYVLIDCTAQQLHCGTNYQNSNYDAGRYCDRLQILSADGKKAALPLEIIFPNNIVIDLVGEDVLTLEVQVQSGFAAGHIPVQTNIAVAGTTVSPVISQIGIPFIDADNSYIEVDYVPAEAHKAEFATPYFKTYSPETGDTNFSRTLGDNVLNLTLLDSRFSRVSPVGLDIADPLTSIHSATIESSQYSNPNVTVAELHTQNQRFFSTDLESIPRRFHYVLLAGSHFSACPDFDGVTVNISLDKDKVNSETLTLMHWQFFSDERLQKVATVRQQKQCDKIRQKIK